MYGTVSWIRAEPVRQRTADLAFAAGLCALVLASAAYGPARMRTPVSGWLVAVTVLVCSVVPLRRRRPGAALAVATAGTAAYLAEVGYHPPLLLAPLVLLHHTAATADRRTALRRGVPAVAVLVAGRVMATPADWLSSRTLAVAAMSLLALVAGDAARSRRDYVAEVEERALWAEHDRENEARRRVAEERMRIARDLHDQVGHQLALITVQAGVADYVLDERPDQARQALELIRQAGRAALEELKDTVGLLRGPGDADAPTAPTVGLAGLGELVESFRSSGLAVEHRVDGAVRTLTPAADVTAYRVVQESLTNICKHAGPVATRLRMDYLDSALHIVVENEDGSSLPAAGGGPGAAVPAAGHGLRGMQERVGIVGGTLNAGPRPGGGFRVSAVLPLSGAAEAAR